jgi:hypothetical protein
MIVNVQSTEIYDLILTANLLCGLVCGVPNDPRKRKRNRSPGQTQIAISIDAGLLEQIKARAKSREQTISGYLRYLALRDLEAAEKETPGNFPPSQHTKPYVMNDKPEGRGK